MLVNLTSDQCDHNYGRFRPQAYKRKYIVPLIVAIFLIVGPGCQMQDANFHDMQTEVDVRSATRQFYDTQGEWKGVFRMRTVNRMALTFNSPTEVRADVEYIFECIKPGDRLCFGQRDGVDRRWFILRKNSAGEWVGQGMGEHMSARFR